MSARGEEETQAGGRRCGEAASAWHLTASPFSFSRYVYIPVGGSQHGLLGTLFSTAVTFAFVSYWHGGNDYLWCWAALNWLGVTVESGVRRLVQKPSIQDSLVSGALAFAAGDSQARRAGFGREGNPSSHLSHHGPSLLDFFKACVPRGWTAEKEASVALSFK